MCWRSRPSWAPVREGTATAESNDLADIATVSEAVPAVAVSEPGSPCTNFDWDWPALARRSQAASRAFA